MFVPRLGVMWLSRAILFSALAGDKSSADEAASEKIYQRWKKFDRDQAVHDSIVYSDGIMAPHDYSGHEENMASDEESARERMAQILYLYRWRNLLAHDEINETPQNVCAYPTFVVPYVQRL